MDDHQAIRAMTSVVAALKDGRRANQAAAADLAAEVDDVATALDKAETVTKTFTDSLTSGLEDAIFAGDSLRDVLSSLVNDVGRSLFQQTVGFGIEKGLGTAFGAILPGIFGGARAAGGPVSPGRAFMVGERGPEIFSPSVPGVISPNGAGGGTTFNVDMRGASVEAVSRLEGFVASLNANLERRAVSAVQFERQNDPVLFA